MEIWIAVVALSVAVWQLNLQRQEMQRNTRINSLIHMSTLLKERIEFYERIIQNMKSKKQDWTKPAFFKVVVASAVKFMPPSSTAFLLAQG